MNIFHSKKFRYGSVSLAFTIIIIAAVILFTIWSVIRLVNALFDLIPFL